MVWVSGAIRTLSPDRFPSPITCTWRRTPPSNPRNASPHFRVHNEVPLGAPILSHLRSENRLTESTGCPTGKRSATRVARDSGSALGTGEAGKRVARKPNAQIRRNASRGCEIAGRKLEPRARAISRRCNPRPPLWEVRASPSLPRVLKARRRRVPPQRVRKKSAAEPPYGKDAL